MTSLHLLLIFLCAALTTFALSGLLRRHAVSLGLIDIPNERSSHSKPVPRGGGIAIALVFLATLPLLHRNYGAYNCLFLSLYGAGALIALVGFIDDRSHIPTPIRLATHFIAAAWVLYFIYPTPAASCLMAPPSTWLNTVVFGVFLVWLLNLYNFMDGIDAITGSETLTVTLSAALLSWLLLPDDPSWVILLLLAAAVAGFFVWNLPPAKLFMGDAGSAFLGMVIGALVLHGMQISEPLLYAWIILLGVYIVDATVTLIRRITFGERFYQAHRTHAYQHAALRHRSHGKVSLVVALINLFWLLPAAASVVYGLISGPAGILITYLPLTATAFYFKAGVREAARHDQN